MRRLPVMVLTMVLVVAVVAGYVSSHAYGNPPPPLVTSIDPSSGSIAGGNTVVIRGFFPGINPPYEEEPRQGRISFDGLLALYYVDSDTQVRAIAPPHAAGTVTVEISCINGYAYADYTYAVTHTYLRGTDRYDTAVRISKVMFPSALPAGSGLVLAPGSTFPEALCGAPLASVYGGPMLLTYKTALANNVKAELQRLAPTYVFCIGLSGATVSSVITALPTATVTSITGATVYDMSYKVANALGAKVGDMTGATAIVTRGDVFPDAIGVSPLACAKKWPILLTESGGSNALNASSALALNELGITKALKVGTYAALPTEVEGVGNCSGSDRYVTNANVAAWASANAGLAFTHIGVTNGAEVPRCSGGGTLPGAGQRHAVLEPALRAGTGDRCRADQRQRGLGRVRDLRRLHRAGDRRGESATAVGPC